MSSQVLQYTVCIGTDQYKYINLVNNSECYLSIHEIARYPCCYCRYGEKKLGVMMKFPHHLDRKTEVLIVTS